MKIALYPWEQIQLFRWTLYQGDITWESLKTMSRLPSNLTGIPEEPIQDFTKPPVIEGVARKPSNEIVIPLEELEKKNESGFEVPNKGRSPSF